MIERKHRLILTAALALLFAGFVSAPVRAGNPHPFSVEIPIPGQTKTMKGYCLIPDAAAVSCPTIFIYTNYNAKQYRNLIRYNFVQADELFGPEAKTHFAYICVDAPGRYENTHFGLMSRKKTAIFGYHIVGWIADQTWCSGKIGMSGRSADGANQYFTAETKPPDLTAIAPEVARLGDSYFRYYPGGVWEESWSRWADHEYLLFSLVIGAHPEPWDSFWDGFCEVVDPARIEVPAMVQTGWWDQNEDYVISSYEQLTASSPAGQYTKFVIGPWSHNFFGQLVQGDIRYYNANQKNKHHVRKFYDYWLRGIQNGLYAEDPITYYVLGSEAWRTTPVWPPAGMTDITLFLRENGALSLQAPGSTSVPDRYLFDPGDPSPSIGGITFGPYDDFPDLKAGPCWQDDDVLAGRDDYAVYDTPMLPRDVTAVGPVALKLYVEADRPDTDMMFRLCDYDPNGPAGEQTLLLQSASKRMRYRDGFDKKVWMQKNTIYEVTIPMDHICQTWKAGHRIRIIVSSSNHPVYAVNPNNKEHFTWSGGAPEIATIDIHHDAGHPAALTLPVWLGK